MKKYAECTINFRPTEQGMKTVDNIARRAGVSRSDAMRLILEAVEQKQLTIALIPQQQQAQHANQ